MDREGIRKACMALPAVTLDHPFGDDHDAYKVGGRMFAIVGGEGGVSFKVSDIAFCPGTVAPDRRLIWRGRNG